MAYFQVNKKQEIEGYELRTMTGDIVSFTPSYSEPLPEPFSNLHVKCELTPSLDGYSALNLTACGVNLWDEEWEVGGINTSGIPFDQNTRIRSKNYIPVIPDQKYYIKSPVQLRVCQYDGDKNFIQLNGVANAEFTPILNCRYLLFATNNDSYGTTYNNDISINYPSTDTTYHAYKGNAYTIAFGQTVYGGVLDVASGKLHVTHTIVDLGDLNWTYNAGTYSRFYSPGIASVVKAPETADIIPNILATSYEVTSFRTAYQQQTNNVISITDMTSAARGNVNIVDDNYSDANVFKTAVAGQKLVYELATPFDIDLTPEVISAVVGTNNVFADCGQTEVTCLI